MPSKYDTNPLDPDFPEKARAAAATQVLNSPDVGTRLFDETAPTEEQTRRFALPDVSAYQQPFDGSYSPAAYQPASLYYEDAGKRKVEKIGIPENIAVALPYFPWYIGLVAGALLLILVPKSESKVRFHAAQGLAAHVGILIVTTALGIIDNVTNVADIANLVFQIVMTVMLVVWAIKAWRGRPVHIEAIEALTNWLEEKIDPKLIGNH